MVQHVKYEPSPAAKKQTITSVADTDPKDPYILGLPDPDPLGRDTDPDPAPDPSIILQKIVRKTLNPTVL